MPGYVVAFMYYFRLLLFILPIIYSRKHSLRERKHSPGCEEFRFH